MQFRQTLRVRLGVGLGRKSIDINAVAAEKLWPTLALARGAVVGPVLLVGVAGRTAECGVPACA